MTDDQEQVHMMSNLVVGTKGNKFSEKAEVRAVMCNNYNYLVIIIILELQSWKGPNGSLSPDPVKEAQWGIEFPTSGSATGCLRH